MRHYWDDAGWTMNAFKDALGGFPREPAWDTYVLYGPHATWTGDMPPEPAYWMHQLGSRRQPRATGPYWDPAVFREHVEALVH